MLQHGPRLTNSRSVRKATAILEEACRPLKDLIKSGDPKAYELFTDVDIPRLESISAIGCEYLTRIRIQII